jgi:hypothetical protein
MMAYRMSFAAVSDATSDFPLDQKVRHPVTAFGPVARGRSAANDTPMVKSSAIDGQMGGMILDTLFNMGFPGLGMMFNPLGMTDAVDLYDISRREMSPRARRQFGTRRTPVMPRRKAPILSFIFG